MKTLLNIALLLLISTSVMAQLSNEDRVKFENKVTSYTKMKKTGSTLAIVGGGLTVVGAVLVSSADWEETTDAYGQTQYNTNDSSGALGIVALAAGIPLTVTGIILSSVGNRKMKEYAKKLENVNMGYYQHGQQKGVSLSITF